jgi:hypothetical protein
MNSQIRVAFYLLLFIVLGSGAVWVSAKSPAPEQIQTGSLGIKQGLSPLARLNEIAGAARADDKASVRALVDEIFTTVELPSLPAVALDDVKDRLVRAEINYLSGKQDGIAQPNVVCTAKMIADKLQAPAYARTSEYEVKILRASMLSLLPNMIARDRPGNTGSAEQIGSPLKPMLSPVEAAFLTLTLLQQKQTNPDYQLTYDERVAQWASKYAANPPGSKAEGGRLVEVNTSGRAEEMRRMLDLAASQLPVTDLLNLPGQALDMLGVQR